MKVTEYAYSKATQRLLVMAMLPVIDGYFISFLSTGLWRDMGQALAFGMTAFSGGACVAAAMLLPGSLRARLLQVLGIYAGLAVLILVATAFQPVLAQIIPANLSLFTSVFLIGLGLYTTGVPLLKRVGAWTGFEAAVKVILVATLIRAVTSPGMSWQPALDSSRLGALAVAWAGGLGLTLSGVLLGYLVKAVNDKRPLDWGAGISLVLMGLRLLGLMLPGWLVLTPLVVGYAVMLLRMLPKYRPAELNSIVDA